MAEDQGAYTAAGGPTGVLVLHGFTGSPRSMRPLADAFAAAGMAVELPLLPGHGTTPAELAETGYPDWFAAAEAALSALKARCEAVVVAGLSMGGTLTLDLALAHPELSGVVLINPMVDPPVPAFATMLRAAVASGTTSIPSIGSDVAKPGVESSGYAETPIAPMLTLFAALEAIAPRLSELTLPVLLFSSRVDHVVPPASGDLVAESVSGPLERVFLEQSFHVATLDHDAALIETTAVEFARKVTTSR